MSAPRQLAIQINDYLDHLSVERALSANTVAAYRRDLARYLDYCTAQGVDDARQVTDTLVTAYARDLASGDADHEGLARSSVSRMTSAVRGLHKFLLLESVTTENPTADLHPAVPARRLPKALPVDQVLAMLTAPDTDEPTGIRDRALLEVLYGTGARVSEAVGLDLDDVDFDGRALILHGKGGKSRMVPLGTHAIAALDVYLVRSRPVLATAGTGTPAVFLNQRGKRLSRQSSWAIIQRAAARAKVPGHVSPHSLRHSYATHLLDGGADVRVVQELLGHASVTTTQIYTMVTVDKLREVYVSTHPRALG